MSIQSIGCAWLCCAVSWSAVGQEFPVVEHPAGEDAVVADGESRGGGDTCGTAAVISELPFTDTGYTCEFFDDDYEEACPSAGKLAPDVVYRYTPAADTVVDISLCGSDYDTIAYVYEDSCGGPPVACDDDGCGAVAGASELIGVGLAAGHIYYIVVDGFDFFACGDFLLIITEGESLPDCPPDALLSQPVHGPADGWSIYGLSDEAASTLLFENFGGLGEPVCEIQWWGLEYTSSLANCTRDPNTFDVTFYADAGGQPGSETCSDLVMPARVDTGLVYAAQQLILYEYSAELSPCCALVGGWVSIQGVGDPDCRFFWMSSGTGDGACCRDIGEGIECGVDPLDFDLSLCLAGGEPAGLIGSTPDHDASLPRTAHNLVRLAFDQDILVPDENALRIEMLDSNGAFGPSYTIGTDGSADFEVTVGTNGLGQPRVLEIRENGSVLANQTWIAVRNTGDWAGVLPFEVHTMVQWGDVDDDGSVLFADISTIIPGLGQFADDDDRRDVDGEGHVLIADISSLIPYLGSTPVAKPSGHAP